MELTPYHSKYFAFELTRQHAANLLDEVEKRLQQQTTQTDLFTIRWQVI